MSKSKADTMITSYQVEDCSNTNYERRLTVQQIPEYLPEVPQDSLYRHLKQLAIAEIIVIVEENKVRGTTENKKQMEINS